MRILVLSTVCVSAFLMGCDLPVNVDSKKSSSKSSTVANEAETVAQAPVETERVVAEGGVGKQGKSLQGDDVNQTIATPARVLFDFKQDAKFIVVQHTVNAYEALNGKVPQTHEAFMKEIIEANNIKLPELSEGEKYVWVPEEKKLYVERPVRK